MSSRSKIEVFSNISLLSCLILQTVEAQMEIRI
jgi:hypothetical protein